MSALSRHFFRFTVPLGLADAWITDRLDYLHIYSQSIFYILSTVYRVVDVWTRLISYRARNVVTMGEVNFRWDFGLKLEFGQDLTFRTRRRCRSYRLKSQRNLNSPNVLLYSKCFHARPSEMKWNQQTKVGLTVKQQYCFIAVHSNFCDKILVLLWNVVAPRFALW